MSSILTNASYVAVVLAYEKCNPIFRGYEDQIIKLFSAHERTKVLFSGTRAH